MQQVSFILLSPGLLLLYKVLLALLGLGLCVLLEQTLLELVRPKLALLLSLALGCILLTLVLYEFG